MDRSFRPGSPPAWRNKAIGRFWRRYPFVKPRRDLSCVVAAWTKGDSDVLITFESPVAAGVMTKKEVVWAEAFVKRIAKVVAEELASKGLHLIEGKSS